MGTCPPGLEGCHDNGNHLDNWVNNLYWGTKSDNALDSVRHGTHRNARLTHCNREHLLALPNLRRGELAKGNRACLACGRAWSNVQTGKRKGITVDLRATADEHYRRIMAA